MDGINRELEALYGESLYGVCVCVCIVLFLTTLTWLRGLSAVVNLVMGLLFVFATRETERLLCHYIGKAHPNDNFHTLKKDLNVTDTF